MHESMLREAYARAMVQRAGDRAACPPPEEVERLAATDRHAETGDPAFDHVMSCRACLGEYELLRSIRLAERGPVVARPVTRWQPFAMAAGVLAAVALGGVVLRGRDTVRGAGDGVALVHDEVRHARGDSLRLVWHAVAGTDAYRVDILTPAGSAVLSETTADTTIAVAPDALPELPELDWLVVATRVGGNERRSPIGRITLVR